MVETDRQSEWERDTETKKEEGEEKRKKTGRTFTDKKKVRKSTKVEDM